jgi:DNA-binding NtrC family response regulator
MFVENTRKVHAMAVSWAKNRRLLIVDDDDTLRKMLTRFFQERDWSILDAEDGAAALVKEDENPCDVALIDLTLPDMTGIELLARLKAQHPEGEVIVLTAHGSVETAIEAIQRGAYTYLTKPIKMLELDAHIEKAYEKVQLARRERQWLDHLRYESPRYQLVGSSAEMRRVVQLIERVAPTEATVLIGGESGTGKELVARALHFNSERCDRPLVTVNCAALQETLIESEIFGYERGAFTGAQQTKRGLVEVAEGGTLFIDEIGEMAPGLQAKLLRVLEDGHYRRVGSTRDARADVRVIAATNRRLEEEIKAGRFREDLYHRLNVVPVKLPPLRERRSDIPELVSHFLATRPVRRICYQVQPDALEALCSYDWPGNVRELANVLERGQILAEGYELTLDDFPESIALSESPPEEISSDPLNLRDLQRRHVGHVLQLMKGNKLQAAKALGISRRALYRLILKYRLDHRPAASDSVSLNGVASSGPSADGKNNAG